MFRFIAACAVAVGIWFFLGPSDVQADFIVEPAGTLLYDGNNAEDTVTKISGLNLKFFGQTISSVWVAENGNLNFSGDGSFFPKPLGVPSVARVAPMWDDFLLLQNPSNSIDNRVLVDSQPGSYLAVTWQNVRLHLETESETNFPNTTRSAQVVWFESANLINGIHYLAGDIAFGYVPHLLGTTNFGTELNATVGLDSGTGTIVALPGTSNGLVTAANAHLLGAHNQVVLFRAQINGGYTASLITIPVPEPSPMVLVACSSLLLLLRRAKRPLQSKIRYSRLYFERFVEDYRSRSR